MLKKKLVIMNLAVMMGLGSTFVIPSAKAETSSNLSKVQQERVQLEKSINNADQELSKVKEELARLNEQTKRVDQAIADNNSKIKETEQQIASANSEINLMEANIAELEETIKNRTEILKNRAISYQHSGGNVDYLEVLIGSSSFSDFVNRALLVGKILEADNALLGEHLADEHKLQETKAAKVKKLANLEDMKTELVGIKELVLQQKAENDQLKEKLKDEETAALTAKASLQQKEQSLASQEASIKQAIARENAAAKVSSNAKTTVNKSSNSSSKKESNNSSTSPVASTPVNSNGTVNDLIRAGYKYIGNSVYVFGGGRNAYDIANGRFDCSAFVNWAFSTIGVRVGASTDSLKNQGTRVPVSEMQPGDLVFFDTYKKDGHVGIYVGGGKYIGSQSSTGVAIANMSSGYWKEKFNGRVMRISLN